MKLFSGQSVGSASTRQRSTTSPDWLVTSRPAGTRLSADRSSRVQWQRCFNCESSVIALVLRFRCG
jgi:hypothetical protein